MFELRRSGDFPLDGMLYAVCTKCTFLRAFSRSAGTAVRVPEKCPACGADLVTRRKLGRFQPTYVGRVALELHQAPSLGAPEQQQQQQQHA